MVGRTSYDYSGESAIVTGSTKGIGRGIVEGLVDAGANVLINSRTESDVDAAVEELNEYGEGTVVGFVGDMGVPADIESMVETAINAFGQVDLLVNNAAVWPQEQTLVESDIETWEYAMNVNVRSQYYASKLVAVHMIEQDVQGSIVNHSSQTGDRRTGNRGLYGISKTAINGLTWRMAGELAQHGIRMNAISTDMTETHQLRYEAEMEAEDGSDRTSDDVLREWGESIPIGRLGQPSDLADAVLFLGSDRASYIVGTTLRVAGGGNLQ